MSEPRSGIITLLTDFGLSDPFVGIMKGVILSRFRAASVVDLCHGIPPQSVADGAFWLERSYRWFPPGTVHVAVVDPGVGSERRILAARRDGHIFLAPDNGLLAASLTGVGAELRALDPGRLGLPAPSATFHGRDVFAPFAAELASGGLAFADVGAPAIAEPCVLAAPRLEAGALCGAVVTVDRFGNLITNLDRTSLEATGARRVLVGGREVPLRRTYADVAHGELLAVINAFEVLELAIRDGSAERQLGLGRGTPVRAPIAGRVMRA
ncbi:MAG TPA: SAM-dependent chlorinase/fluorinase [Polyangiaceae bacterium]|nr:SAM-dependent chlorinase/fluorinase [Polyangiaceae bacterium]